MTDIIQIKMNGEHDSSDGTDVEATPKKSTLVKSNTPLKTLLLSNTPYHANSVEKNKLIGLLLDMIVDLNLPISTVDQPTLVKYTSALNNRFRIPCRQTYTKTIIPQKVISIFKTINDIYCHPLNEFILFISSCFGQD